VDALKNLAEEFVDIGNVHHQLQEYISQEIVRLMLFIQQMSKEVIKILGKSNDKKDLYK
jgi:hypothetical protein